MTTKTKAPQIKITLSLDGTVHDIRVLADTEEDRERALNTLRRFLPNIEALEHLALEPEGEV